MSDGRDEAVLDVGRGVGFDMRPYELLIKIRDALVANGVIGEVVGSGQSIEGTADLEFFAGGVHYAIKLEKIEDLN